MKKRWMVTLALGLGLAFLAGCKSTKVHIEEERTIEETRPVVTESGERAIRTFRMDKDGKVRLEEETTTEETRPIIVGD